MLAPLENRAILERAPAGETDDAAENDAIHLQAENHALRAALERVRRRQKRLVFLGGRRSLQQAQRITLLEQRCAHYQNRLSELESGQAIIELLFALNADAGTTLVLVTHDDHLAARCQRLIRLDAGRLQGAAA